MAHKMRRKCLLKLIFEELIPQSVDNMSATLTLSSIRIFKYCIVNFALKVVHNVIQKHDTDNEEE